MLRFAGRVIETNRGHEAGRELLAELYRAETGREMPSIFRERRGKPRFSEGALHFSVTHTKNHVFVALSDRPIGIDAEEKDRPIRPELAEKILSPAEKGRYAAAQDRREALLKLWVLKEAWVKYTGEGLRGYPNHTDFAPEDPRVFEREGCYVAVIEEDEYAV